MLKRGVSDFDSQMGRISLGTITTAQSQNRQGIYMFVDG